MKEPFKLKTPFEIIDLIKGINSEDGETQRPILNYIDELHNKVKSYQLVIDFVENANQKIIF